MMIRLSLHLKNTYTHINDSTLDVGVWIVEFYYLMHTADEINVEQKNTNKVSVFVCKLLLVLETRWTSLE